MAQHVGGGEQVRRLHASRPTVCTVEAASSRGYCARRGGLGPERAPRTAMSALGPSPTALAAAAKARARMLRPRLPPRGGAARGPPPHSLLPAALGTRRPAPAVPPATLPFCRRGTEAAGVERTELGGAECWWPEGLRPLSAELGEPPRAKIRGGLWSTGL